MEHEEGVLIVAAAFDAYSKMFDFMLGVLRAALAHEKMSSPSSFRDLVRSALHAHRGDHQTVGPHQLSDEEMAIANAAFREHFAELHARIAATLDAFED